ncbi:thioredoxin [Capsulimonas corticalis]|uniref:Thioredoxin n=1 Tax=Capsulimonas corticalis TaxID=2219043 RepID=A0A402CVH6_9BACT|nr:TlpA disulfide reductase family protein [Capsulimonas corticalis]BDI30404.1 thioredoxin [Capsulimonas corticalis]
MRHTTLAGLILAFGALAIGGPGRAQDAVLPAGTKAPAFTTRTISGAPLSMQSLRGKVVLMDFWATWCGPCRMATPTLQSLHKKFAAKGLKVIGVSIDDPNTLDQVKPFMKTAGVTYTISATPASNMKAAQKYNVSGIPAMFLIDKKGYVRWSQAGYGEGEEAGLSVMIKKLLAEKA